MHHQEVGAIAVYGDKPSSRYESSFRLESLEVLSLLIETQEKIDCNKSNYLVLLESKTLGTIFACSEGCTLLTILMKDSFLDLS
jgi:hypothetical protein